MPTSAPDALGGELRELRALLEFQGDVLAGLELGDDSPPPRGDRVTPRHDPEPELADPVDCERAAPAIVLERLHPDRLPTALPAAVPAEVEAHRDVVMAVGERIGFDHDGVAGDTFDRVAATLDVRTDAPDLDLFGTTGHPQHELLDDAKDIPTERLTE